jgi:chromosome segregation ATPase
LDFFIVDTVIQAKEVSDYLTAKRIGRMTFLIK